MEVVVEVVVVVVSTVGNKKDFVVFHTYQNTNLNKWFGISVLR